MKKLLTMFKKKDIDYYGLNLLRFLVVVWVLYWSVGLTFLFGQNKARYAYTFYGGINVGGTYNTNRKASALPLDSMIIESGLIKFYTGATLLDAGSAGSMVYPGAGIPLSTGSAWGTSITNASANWNTAYGWGNHASAGYLTSQTSHTDVVVDGDFASQGIMLRGATSGTYSILTNNSTNWNTAFGWGNHAGLYDPLNTASGLFSTHNSTYTHANIANGQTAFGWGNHASAGYAASSHSQAQSTITALPDSLLIRYTKTQTNTRLNLKENSLGNPGVTGYVLSSTDAGVRSWVAQSAGYTNLTSFVAQTNWRVFYSNGSGDVTELALGADGTYLKSNGAAVAPTFSSIAGGGDVTKVATPLNDQVAVWTGDGTIEGTTGLTYSGTNLLLTGDIGATATRITKGWFTDLQVTNAIAGAVTGNAGTVTGYTPASGSITLAGADAITFTTSDITSVTLPTTGTLATTSQLDAKANLASPTFTGTVGGITYTMVGAAASSHNQAQTTITALPDSLLVRYTKTQADTRYNLKANLASPTFTGTVTIPSPFTLGATSVTANGAELNVLDNIPGTLTSTELGYVDGVTSAIQTQLDSKVKLLPDSVAYTSNSTLALTDANKIVMATKATSIILTIPANATAAIPVGTTINFVQCGAGIMVFKEASGVNLYSKKDSIATGGIRSWAALYKRGTNNWILYGDILD